MLLCVVKDRASGDVLATVFEEHRPGFNGYGWRDSGEDKGPFASFAEAVSDIKSGPAKDRSIILTKPGD